MFAARVKVRQPQKCIPVGGRIKCDHRFQKVPVNALNASYRRILEQRLHLGERTPERVPPNQVLARREYLLGRAVEQVRHSQEFSAD